MRRKMFSIWSVLLILAISLGVLMPGCEGEPTTGTIIIKATLDGSPWTGNLTYVLTPSTGGPINGLCVEDDFIAGSAWWSLTYISAGPDGAHCVNITPSSRQLLTQGGTITFTLNFEKSQDASIEVKATLCGEVYEGAVAYSLSVEGESVVHNVEVPTSATVAPGEWACNVSFNPPGAYLVDITPSPTQSVSGGDTITFTLNFELEQDASIEFLTWTINGQNVTPNTHQTPYDVFFGDVIDVHYTQRVDGCQGEVVEVKEKSELWIHYTQGGTLTYFAVQDHWGAVVKEPEPIEKVSQMVTLNGLPIDYMEFTLPIQEPPMCAVLGVETIWLLEKCTNYTKTIDWLDIWPGPGGPGTMLFDITPSSPSSYYTLVSTAQVELVDDEHVNPEIKYAESPPLYVRMWAEF